MTDKELDNILAHHGVPGMKWGVRKDPDSSSSGRMKRRKKVSGNVSTVNKPKPQVSEDYINKLRLKNKPLASLSNAELRSFSERMQLEKTYAQLTAKPKSKAVAIVAEILGAAAKKTATKYVSAYLDKGVAAVVGDPTKKKT